MTRADIANIRLAAQRGTCMGLRFANHVDFEGVSRGHDNTGDSTNGQGCTGTEALGESASMGAEQFLGHPNERVS